MVSGRESGDPKKLEKHLQIAKGKELRNKIGVKEDSKVQKVLNTKSNKK